MRNVALCAIILITAVSADAQPGAGDLSARLNTSEERALKSARNIFPDDLGLRYLIDSYKEQDKADLKRISFGAISVYIQQTLLPKTSQMTAEQKEELEKYLSYQKEHDLLESQINERE